MSRDLLFNSSFDVLFDAFTVKNVPALRLNGILCNVIADTADGGFSDLIRAKRVGVCFALEHEIGMASHLPHSSETVLQVSSQTPEEG